MRGQLLAPRTIVSYDREAFCFGPGNVRITLDRNLRSGFDSRDFFKSRACPYSGFGRLVGVLEVKYDEFLPQLVRMAVQVPGRQAAAYSKYAVCADTIRRIYLWRLTSRIFLNQAFWSELPAFLFLTWPCAAFILCGGAVYFLCLQEMLRRRHVLRQFWRYPDCSVYDHGSFDPGGDIEYCSVFGYGRRTVHCPFPHGHQGAVGYRLPFLGHCCGIVLAAGFIPLAVMGSFLIGAVLMFFSRFKSHEQPYILVLHCQDGEAEKRAESFVRENAARLCLKSKSVSPGRVELNFEMRLKDEDTDFINELAAMPGVLHTVLVSYNGDYMN